MKYITAKDNQGHICMTPVQEVEAIAFGYRLNNHPNSRPTETNVFFFAKGET